MNLNKVTIAGNLTRDIELRFIPNGKAVGNAGIAINRTWKGEDGAKKEETTFIDVEFWGKTAEVVAQHLKKGNPIYIEGRLKLEQWDDKQSGQKRSKLKVVAESFQFVGSRGERTVTPAASEQAAKPDAGSPEPEPSDVPF